MAWPSPSQSCMTPSAASNWPDRKSTRLNSSHGYNSNAAFCLKKKNPRDRVAGFRILHLLPGVGPASAQRVLDHMSEAADPLAALCRLPSPPRASADWGVFTET